MTTTRSPRRQPMGLMDHLIAALLLACIAPPALAVVDTDRLNLQKRSLSEIANDLAKTRPLLVMIAEDVEGEALATLVVNRLRGSLAGIKRDAQGLQMQFNGLANGGYLLTGAQVRPRCLELGALRQRVLSARSILASPSMILLDETLAGAERKCLKLVRELGN